MTAADSGPVTADPQHRLYGAPIVAGSESKRPINEAPTNFGRQLPIVARTRALIVVERLLEACDVIRVGRAGGGEGAMQIVEGEQMVVDMRHPRARDRGPAVADVDACEFEPPQKRSCVDAVEHRVIGELRRGE